MRILFYLIVLYSLLGINAYAEVPFSNPDIVAQTKVSTDWSKVLVTKVQQLFLNLGLPDPFNYNFNSDIIIDNINLDNLIPSSSKKLASSLSKISGISLIDVKPSVRISGLRYNVGGVAINVTNLKNDDDKTIISTDISASNVTIFAKNLNLSLKLQGSSKVVSVLDVDIKDLQVEVKDKDLIKFLADIQVMNDDGYQRFKFLNSNFENVARGLLSREDSLDLKFSDFNIKAAKIRIGKSKVIEVKPDQVEALLNENISGVKGFLISQVAKQLSNGINDFANKIIEKGRLKNEYWVRSKFFSSQYLISKVSPSQDERNLEVQLFVNHCMKGRHRAIGVKCIKENAANSIVSRITPDMYQKSMDEMENMIHREDANLVASISEDFMTKTILAAYKSGAWDDVIKKAGVMVGPKKFRVVIDDKSNAAKVYIDLIHKNNDLERIALVYTHTRFTIGLRVSVKVINDNGISKAVAKIESVDTTDAILLKGKPEFGFFSNVGRIGLFQGAVKEKVKNTLLSFEGKELFQYPLPEKMQKLGLEDVEFKGDGQGRMNAFFNISHMLN